VGCSNAHSTLEWAAQKRIEVRGLDYVPEMIAAAEERLAQSPDLSDRVEFAVGDVTALAEPDAAYDVVVSVRVLINLGSWDRQRTALQEYARVLKPGGRLILSEATLQGWNHLNDFRREWGLAPIPMPGFNHYLDRDNVAQALSPHLQLVERLNFSSTYYVATRLLKPLLIKAVDAPVDVADPLTHWNRWSALLPPLGDWGVQELFLFSKGGAI
jgi:SAM-dependent methyltransferase